MKEEELIKLKKELLNQLKNQKYAIYTPIVGGHISDVKNRDKINSTIDTPASIKKFEMSTEEYMRKLIFSGIDFDLIEITLDNNVFVSEFFIRKAMYSHSLDEKIASLKMIYYY